MKFMGISRLSVPPAVARLDTRHRRGAFQGRKVYRRFAKPAQPILKTCRFERKYGAPGGVRTPDLVLRRHTLYPSELRAH
jgi:hypothetical protein